MKNKKVCHISIVHKKNDIRIFHKECISLAKAGYDVTYLTSYNVDQYIQGVHILGINLNKKLGKLYRYIFGDRKIIKKALNLKSDVYHIHDPELIRFAKKLKKNNSKVIYDSHENTPMQILEKEWIPKFWRHKISIIADKIEISNIKYCDMIFAVADSTCDRFHNYKHNVIKLENLPILKEFEDITIDYNIKNEKNIFCYSGAIWNERGLQNTCFSVEGISNCKLQIAGRIDINNIRDYINKLPINTFYLGYLTRNEIHKLYENSICGLCLFLPYPNNMIDPPTKIYEYMAAGIPTICSNFKSMEDVVLKNKCGISVNPENIEEIKNAIKYILEHKDEARQMGENGLEAIKNKLNWETHERVLLDAYGSLK